MLNSLIEAFALQIITESGAQKSQQK